MENDTVLALQMEALEAMLAGDWQAAAIILEKLPDDALKVLDVAASDLASMARRTRVMRIRHDLGIAADSARDAAAFGAATPDSSPDWKNEPC